MEHSWGSRVSNHTAPMKRWAADSGESVEACGPATGMPDGITDACFGGCRLRTSHLQCMRTWVWISAPMSKARHGCSCLWTQHWKAKTDPPKSSLASQCTKEGKFPVPREILAHGNKAEGKEVFCSDIFVCTQGRAYLHIHIHGPHTEATYNTLTYNIYTQHTYTLHIHHIHNTHTHTELKFSSTRADLGSVWVLNYFRFKF